MTFDAFLRTLGGSVVGIHLPACAEHDAVTDACRKAGMKIVGIATAPDVIITADGVLEDGIVRPLKEEVDAAVPDARTVVVLRLVGDAPLAPTLDAYLDVEMCEGRDIWFDDAFGEVLGNQVGASG